MANEFAEWGGGGGISSAIADLNVMSQQQARDTLLPLEAEHKAGEIRKQPYEIGKMVAETNLHAAEAGLKQQTLDEMKRMQVAMINGFAGTQGYMNGGPATPPAAGGKGPGPWQEGLGPGSGTAAILPPAGVQPSPGQDMGAGPSASPAAVAKTRADGRFPLTTMGMNLADAAIKAQAPGTLMQIMKDLGVYYGHDVAWQEGQLKMVEQEHKNRIDALQMVGRMLNPVVDQQSFNNAGVFYKQATGQDAPWLNKDGSTPPYSPMLIDQYKQHALTVKEKEELDFKTQKERDAIEIAQGKLALEGANVAINKGRLDNSLLRAEHDKKQGLRIGQPSVQQRDMITGMVKEIFPDYKLGTPHMNQFMADVAYDVNKQLADDPKVPLRTAVNNSINKFKEDLRVSEDLKSKLSGLVGGKQDTKYSSRYTGTEESPRPFSFTKGEPGYLAPEDLEENKWYLINGKKAQWVKKDGKMQFMTRG